MGDLLYINEHLCESSFQWNWFHPICLSEQKVMVDLLQPTKSEFLGQFQMIITPRTQWSGWDTIYQRKDMRVLFLMKLVSSNLDIWVKCYGWSTSDYQNSPSKDRFKNYFLFLGAFWSFPLTQNPSKPYIKDY